MITVHLDTREFDAAIKFYAEHVKKDAKYIVNRQALNVIIKAIAATPKGIREAVDKSLFYIGQKQSKTFKKQKGSLRRVATGKTKTIPSFSNPLIYKILNKNYKGLKRGQGVKRFLARRRNAIGYSKAAWWPAALTFEALKTGLRASGQKAASKKFAKMVGGGVGAKESYKALASFFTAARGSDKIGRPALKTALALAATDMRDYIAKKFKETAKKVAVVK